VTDPFYRRTLTRLLDEGVASTDDRIVVVCGGPVDRDTLVAAGFTNVVITNLDQRMVGDEYAPYTWDRQDAEALTWPDDSADWGLVHAGLHHCASPHRALGELLRVGRKGAIAFEARDSLLVRAGVRLGLVEEYEVTAVAANGGDFGGVRNGPVPNHVYRWTEREVRKTVQSLLPAHQHDIRFLYGLRVPTERLGAGWRGALGRTATKAAPVVAKVTPRQGNEFAFVVHKNVRPQPWLRDR
jgi:ubiquinone/menaquinone biosynthesis C-methylase UbiE